MLRPPNTSVATQHLSTATAPEGADRRETSWYLLTQLRPRPNGEFTHREHPDHDLSRARSCSNFFQRSPEELDHIQRVKDVARPPINRPLQVVADLFSQSSR